MVKLARDGRVVVPPAHCASLLPKLAAAGYGGSFPLLFKRDQHRWALQAPASIRCCNADGSQVEIDAVVTDLSADGIGLLTRQSVPTGASAEVFMTVRRFTYSAGVRVAHATATPEGLHIGCKFVVREEPGPRA